MEPHTFENRIEDIIHAINTARQEIYDASCYAVSDSTLRPDIRVDRVVKLDAIIKSLGAVTLKLHQI